jgi:hypothetical protein
MRDAEFHLMIDACSATMRSRPLEVPPERIRWHRFLKLANRHRVQALCWNSLNPYAEALPAEITAAMRSQTRDIVIANLRAVSECKRLLDCFQATGVPLLFLKGLTLGALAYRDPYVKMAVDIDLLVEPDRLGEAAQALKSAGYSPIIPNVPDVGSLDRWHGARKESVWYCREGGFQVDLHTRLADNPSLLGGMTAGSGSQLITVATGIALPTLLNDDLFAYLCVHGASSAWFRLKWITDLVALLQPMSATDLERLYRHSERLGVERAAGQALLLAGQLYSLDLDHLRSRITSDLAVRWLFRVAEGQLFHTKEPTKRVLGTTSIHLSQLALKSGWRFKASEAARQMREMIGAGSP